MPVRVGSSEGLGRSFFAGQGRSSTNGRLGCCAVTTLRAFELQVPAALRGRPRPMRELAKRLEQSKELRPVLRD